MFNIKICNLLIETITTNYCHAKCFKSLKICLVSNRLKINLTLTLEGLMGIYHVVSKKKINYKYKDLIFILLKINTWTKISMNKQKLNMRKLQLRSSSNKGTFGNWFGNSAYLFKKKKKKQKKLTIIMCPDVSIWLFICLWLFINKGNSFYYLMWAEFSKSSLWLMMTHRRNISSQFLENLFDPISIT